MSDSSNAAANENVRANRLIDSTSPYLLQHAHNPVDWYPWGAEALERAKRENKPIFLSIGYSACHWCHVMEREVFEKQDIANIMNQYFVNIKVDREERPDLDEVYMLATQITSGSGGWPMSVWLTPELEPFYAGTYFPPTDGYGRPGFPRLELALAEMWEKDRAKLIDQAKRVAEGVRLHADEMAGAMDGRIDLQLWLGTAIEQFADRFDPENGGLGTAPKFPPSQALLLWMALAARGQPVPLHPDNAVTVLREMTIKTLDGMARGGIYDQIGGGFARYSTDERWLVPHFEKMLYDNAQLAPVYAWASVDLGRPDFARIARQTLDFWLREMTSPQGAFYSTLDADSEGHEGKYYVWTIDEVRQILAHPDDSALLIKHFGMTEAGNFEGKNILFVARGVEELAGEYKMTAEELQKRIDRLCVKLRGVRDGRIKPGLDDKILTGWNGLMISAMAVAGRLLREPRYLEAAHRAMGFLLLKHMEGGRRLLRTSRAGKAHVPAFLEDHAYLLNGLMDIIDATLPTSLPGTMARRRALELADQMIKLFHDPVGQGFFFTHDGHEKLFARTKNGTDNATPSAAAVAIRALLRLGRVSGRTEYSDIAMNAVKRFAGIITKQPSMFATILLALVEDAQTAASNPHLGMGHPLPLAGAGGPFVVPPLGGVHGKAQPLPLASAVGPLRLEAAAVTARAGQSVEIGLVLHVAPGYHVQTQHARGAETFATAARLRTDLPLEVEQWVYPPAQEFGIGGEMSEGLAGPVAITAKCTLSRTAAVGQHTVRAIVTAQPCSDASCLQPEQLAIEIPIEVLANTGG